MHRISSVIDLLDPSATVDGSTVQHVHLVCMRGGGMFAVIAFAKGQAALVPRGRLDLETPEGMRALESFRRWLKQQDVPLTRVSLRTAIDGAYERMIATSGFAVAGLCDAPNEAEAAARFQEWVTSKPMTPARGSPRLSP